MASLVRLWITRAPVTIMEFTILFLVLLSGLSIQGQRTETPSESKAPSAKECRIHVEKALDQYFDTKENQAPTNEDTIKTPQSTTTENILLNTQEDDDEPDDRDEPECEQYKQQTENTINREDSKDDDNNNNDNEDEDGDDDETTYRDSNQSNAAEQDVDNEEDDDDDDAEKDDEKTPKSNDDINSTDVANKDDDNDYNEDDKGIDEGRKYYSFLYDDGHGEIYELKNLKKGSIEHTKEAAKSSNKLNYSRSKSVPKDTDTIKSETAAAESVETSDNDNDDDEDNDDNDGKQIVDTDADEEDGDSDDQPEDIPPLTETRDPLKEKRLNIESIKVTGETIGVPTGVAQKFSGTKSASQQSETKKDSEKTEEVVKTTKEEGNWSSRKEQQMQIKQEILADVEQLDDDGIENIYEDEDDDDTTVSTKYRSRDHIDALLGLDDIGTDYDNEDTLAQSIFRDIKKIHAASIKQMEMLYKYTDSTTRLLGDAEIFGKPMVLFLGPWSTGKSTIINYLLGIERTPNALKTGTSITGVDFNVITYGDKRQIISGTELAANWRYASLQKFGQGFLDHFKSTTMPHTLLKKISLVDTPGILESRKNTERGYSSNDAFQWFIDRADAIYVVLDPTKVDIGAELGTVLDQLKGREVRFILNKADSIRRSDLMKVVGQLFWNLSPLMSGTEAPVIYATSLSSKPFNPTAPAKFLFDQENNFLYDLKETMGKRVENRILYARRHAVRVRNHAKMVDCYLATYYRHKSIFSSKRNIAKQITENPTDYHIYEGLSSLTNVSRYDLPDPTTYKHFFKFHPLYDFKPLASTCSYFRGCPMDKLDNAIANELPELFTKYKKAKTDSPHPATKEEGR